MSTGISTSSTSISSIGCMSIGISTNSTSFTSIGMDSISTCVSSTSISIGVSASSMGSSVGSFVDS